MGFYSGVAGARGYAPRAIVYHNDAGSQGANAAFYRAWLPSHNPELGFAHAYVASDGTFIAENYMNKAWHCGNSVGNRDYIGIEICQSMGDLKTFQQNEQKAFKLGAQICKQFGLTPTPALFPLHKELSPTSCPHRTWDIHGRSIQAIRQYYADQTMKYFKDPNLAPTTNGGSNTGGNTGNTSAGGYKAEVYNVRQVVDVNGLQVRPRQDTTLGAIRTLNKGFTFNATRICKNGQAVKGDDGNTYSTWFEVDGSGWVSGAFVTPVKGGSTPAPSKPAASGTIATIQNWLNVGFGEKLAVDNSGGPATRKALIRAVQAEMANQYGVGLAVDGSFGPACRSAWRAFQQGAKVNNIIKCAQGMLYCKGFDPKGFDGSFGPGMKQAVIAFQRSKGLAQDGSLGPATASALFTV